MATATTIKFGDGLDVTDEGAGVIRVDSSAGGHAEDHDHDGSPTQKLAQANTHESPDTDTDPTALHHTLGTGADQAAAGDHGHTGFAPDDVNYLVGTASGGLSAEIVVGTSPGGELGGTWASPTVDATHSGSAHHDPVTVGTGLDLTGQLIDLDLSEVAAGGELGGFMDAPTVDATHSGSTHAATQAAAEATAATALSGHTGDTSDAHDASAVSFVPAGTIAATDVQAAIEELDTEKSGTGHTHSYQPLDGELTALAGLTSAADKLPYFTGSGTAGVADFTAAGRAILDDADATAQRATLGLTIGTNVQAYDAELAALAGLTSAADKLPYFTGSGTAGVADFTAAGRALLDDAAASNQRTTLGVGTGDSPEFAAVNIGAATDTTITRTGAGDIAVEGNALYRAGGTDVPITDGGTGSSTAAAARTALGLDFLNWANQAGTSFPGSPSTNDRFFRTDRGIEYFYNGTRWLSTTLYDALSHPIGGALTATDIRFTALPYPENYDKWVENLFMTLTVASGGTALGASHKWVLDLYKWGTTANNTALSSPAITIDSGASDGVYRTPITVAIGALIGTTYSGFRTVWTKTGTPGNLNPYGTITYRLVG